MILYALKHPTENMFLWFNDNPPHWTTYVYWSTLIKSKKDLNDIRSNNIRFTDEMRTGIITPVSIHILSEDTITSEDIVEILEQ